MKRITLTLLVILTAIALFSQKRNAKGYVFDKNSNQLIDSIKINVVGTDSIQYSNKVGGFSIYVPKRHHHLLFSKEGYKLVKIPLSPGFQNRPIRVGMQPVVIEKSVDRPSAISDKINPNYKNVITLSPWDRNITIM